MRRMFSKNQIETIAQQFGGTKLYKHEISLYDDEELTSLAGKLIVIMLTSKEISTENENIGSLSFALNITNTNGDQIIYNGYNDGLLYYIADNTLASYGTISDYYVKDEVTPL